MKMDERTALGNLNVLVEIDSQMVMDLDGDSALQTHIAVGPSKRSPEFCKILINACSDSVRVETNNGELPIHKACRCGSLDTVKCPFELYTFRSILL